MQLIIDVDIFDTFPGSLSALPCTRKRSDHGHGGGAVSGFKWLNRFSKNGLSVCVRMCACIYWTTRNCVHVCIQ